MPKFKKGDRVRLPRFGEMGTVVKMGAKMAPIYSEPPFEREQLWQVNIEGRGHPRLVGESLLEPIED